MHPYFTLSLGTPRCGICLFDAGLFWTLVGSDTLWTSLSIAAKAVEAGERALAEDRDVEMPAGVSPELLRQLNIKQSVSASDPSGQTSGTVRKINIVLEKGGPCRTAGILLRMNSPTTT